MTSFREIVKIKVAHSYYQEACRDFEFVIPADTRLLMNKCRLLAKEVEGVLHVVCDAELSQGTCPTAGIFRVGLRPRNLYMSNFTDVSQNLHSEIRYHYQADYNMLSEPNPYPLVGRTLQHTITNAARPARVAFRNGGTELAVKEVLDAGQTVVEFDATGLTAGIYSINEIFPASTQLSFYYVDLELKEAGAIAVADVEFDWGSVPQDLQISFAAKEQALSYYVVARNLTDVEFDSLAVADMGFTEDERPEVEFKRIESEDFGPDDIPAAMLGSGGDRIVLFRSASGLSDLPIPRRERGRKKIQLSKNGDLLIANLPQPGPDKASSDMIIHISKP